MTEFERACRRWVESPFPLGSDLDEADELHAELAQWDTFVADLVVPHSKGAPVARPVYDLGAGMAEFADRLQMYRAPTYGAADLVGRYRDYLELVAAVFANLCEELGWDEST